MKMNDIEYTSNLLCHFVGRTQSCEEDQYQLLLKIINQDHALYADVNHPENTAPRAELKMNYNGERLGELFTFCPCVCFCDIPNESLKIHCGKYSCFGMGFSKAFLISKGARPVTYIPQNYNMEGFGCFDDTPRKPEEFYISYMKQLSSMISLLTIVNENEPLKEQLEEFILKYPNLRGTLEEFVINPIEKELSNTQETIKFFAEISGAWATQCTYVKIFDDTLGKDDPDNYYMEREWRCLHNVRFTLRDIDTLYLPSNLFVERFKNDVPGFEGNFYVFCN